MSGDPKSGPNTGNPQRGRPLRITSSTIHQRVQHNLQRQLAAMDEAQERVIGGRRVRAASDDPAAAADVMASDTRLRALVQYRRNIDSARSRLDAEESVLGQMTEVLGRALELAVGQGTDTANASTRQTAAAEVNELLKTLVQLGNTQHAGRFLFGGEHAGTAPLAADGTLLTQPSSATTPVYVDSRQDVATTHEAGVIFVDSRAISAVAQLAAALTANDADAIRGASADLNYAIERVQDGLGEVGARTNRLEIAAANVEALTLNLKAFRSEIAEVDFEQAITDLVNRQTAFQAALAATSRMLSTTLTDYLR